MNIFKRDASLNSFQWENLGDIKKGRGDLGEDMPVLVYRLMQYTMLDTLTRDLGADKANEYFVRAGHLAGEEFAKNTQDLSVDFDTFLANFQKALQDLRIGILRVEAFDPEATNIVLTIGQDLDCSGLPITNETVCNYDEGFIAGVLYAYTGKEYSVKEVDCWANGDRVCRFNASLVI
ncbi:MAG: 4-vinyl reductase [Betaproteobacteria bacterium]|nr:4-vinyl reductase [Betaproteobacteria bacterium]